MAIYAIITYARYDYAARCRFAPAIVAASMLPPLPYAAATLFFFSPMLRAVSPRRYIRYAATAATTRRRTNCHLRLMLMPAPDYFILMITAVDYYDDMLRYCRCRFAEGSMRTAT